MSTTHRLASTLPLLLLPGLPGARVAGGTTTSPIDLLEPSTSEDELAGRLSEALELRVVFAGPLDPPSSAQRERASARLDVPRALERARLYGCLAVHPRTELEIEVLAGELPLGDSGRASHLLVALEGDEVLSAAVTGRLHEEDGEDQRWGSFLSQLVRAAREIDLAEGPEAWSPWMARLEAPGNAQDRTLRTLLLQRRAMLENSLFSLVVSARSERGARVPGAWIRRPLHNMEELAALSPELAPLLGEAGAERHASLAREVAAELRELDGAGPSVPAARASDVLKQACARCHGEDTLGPARGKGSGDWRTDLRAVRRQLPAGRLRVGYDVGCPPGVEPPQAQEVADGFHALVALLLLQEV